METPLKRLWLPQRGHSSGIADGGMGRAPPHTEDSTIALAVRIQFAPVPNFGIRPSASPARYAHLQAHRPQAPGRGGFHRQ
jgi:hypothetical protein